MQLITERLNFCRDIAAEAVRLALQGFYDTSGRCHDQHKDNQDVVTLTDLAVENLLRDRIISKYPGELILGEEFGGPTLQHGWTLDPIDGTGNFIRGSPLWGISIAYVDKEGSQVGVIAYPVLGYCLSAGRGLGAFKDGQPLHRYVHSSAPPLACLGENNYWKNAGLDRLESRLRDLGWGLAEYRCATVGLGFAALGIVDGYAERHTSLWDIAAGAVICAEAGLKVQLEGQQQRLGMSIVTGTPQFLADVDFD